MDIKNLRESWKNLEASIFLKKMKILYFLVFLQTISCSLIVSKSIKETTLVKDTNFTVAIAITNKGTVPATEISLHDQTFNNGSAFKIIAGKNYQKIPDLPVNSTYKITFIVAPKLPGVIKTYPAVVKYSADGVKYTAFSNFKGIYVEAWAPLVSKITGWLVFLLIGFGVLQVNSWIKGSDKKKN